MPSQPTDYAHLTLCIQHLLDAELLLENEAESLLAEAEAAHQAQERADEAAERQHLEAVVGLTQALIRSETLAASDAHTLLLVANALLDGNSSGDALARPIGQGNAKRGQEAEDRESL